ncbi:hypothetical protein ORI20_09680 [Mycobacterium sp. CVI_P3]|uniref:PPE family protein n=1 Tax=Mycobacterium pinniadriaticum TaxID=2994102 RepID=A0ABT3SCU6_9MYCO|nr:hypothetical protein [Mycobacterium pinniadriaticum]MCX2930545.1 hypothetical protein [Mycobacterium pinniadriaticum]MCX2936969.1 hypothetical protein [Mycobacterium pinniadriaticum]
MSQRTGTVINKFTGAIAVGALTAGALATTGLGSAPSANATCASFFGIGNSADCVSTPTSIAIAIGTGSQALAYGWFSSAVAVGNSAIAVAGDVVQTNIFDFGTAIGNNALAQATGIVGMATQLGSNGVAVAVASTSLNYLGLNTALNVSLGTTVVGGSVVEAIGKGNLAVNLFGNGTGGGHLAYALGTLNTAWTVGGTNNKAIANGGNGNAAFADFGSGNTVAAGPGPLAIAGSILQTGQVVTKSGPGFNINGIKVGGAAATDTTTAAAQHTAKPGTGRSARPAGATNTGKKASRHAARHTGGSKRG